jgi:ribosomal protein S8E
MKKINRVSFIAIALLLFACSDVLEKDITNDMVGLISPMNYEEIESNVVTFKWNSLTDADKYRIQIFKTDRTKILDSLISKTNLTYPLAQGEYQWRVRGENFAYQSSYSLQADFSVVESTDLTNQQIILKNPIDNSYTKNNTLTCNWAALTMADYYEFELLNVTNGETIVFQESNITNPTFIINNTNLSAEAKYKWKVKAVNGTSETPFSSNTFSVDRTNPNQPTNNLPAQNATFTTNQNINFNWSILADIGTIQSPISYIIEFSNDINFTTIIQKNTLTTATFDKSFPSIGNYYWRIKAIDLSDNSSAYSTPFKFIIK